MQAEIMTNSMSMYVNIVLPSQVDVSITIWITCAGNDLLPKTDAANPRQVDAVVTHGSLHSLAFVSLPGAVSRQQQ